MKAKSMYQNHKRQQITDGVEKHSGKKKRTDHPEAFNSNEEKSNPFTAEVTGRLHKAGTPSNLDSPGNPKVNVLVDPPTPPYQLRSISQKSPLSHGSTSKVIPDLPDVIVHGAESGVSVELKMQDGEYVLKIGKRSIPSSRNENKDEGIKQLAQDAAMLFLHAEMLRQIADQMLTKHRESLQCYFS